MAEGLVQTGLQYQRAGLSGLVREAALKGQRDITSDKLHFEAKKASVSEVQQDIGIGIDLALSTVGFLWGKGGMLRGGQKPAGEDEMKPAKASDLPEMAHVTGPGGRQRNTDPDETDSE